MKVTPRETGYFPEHAIRAQVRAGRSWRELIRSHAQDLASAQALVAYRSWVVGMVVAQVQAMHPGLEVAATGSTNLTSDLDITLVPTAPGVDLASAYRTFNRLLAERLGAHPAVALDVHAFDAVPERIAQAKPLVETDPRLARWAQHHVDRMSDVFALAKLKTALGESRWEQFCCALGESPNRRTRARLAQAERLVEEFRQKVVEEKSECGGAAQDCSCREGEHLYWSEDARLAASLEVRSQREEAERQLSEQPARPGSTSAMEKAVAAVASILSWSEGHMAFSGPDLWTIGAYRHVVLCLQGEHGKFGGRAPQLGLMDYLSSLNEQLANIHCSQRDAPLGYSGVDSAKYVLRLVDAARGIFRVTGVEPHEELRAKLDSLSEAAAQTKESKLSQPMTALWENGVGLRTQGFRNEKAFTEAVWEVALEVNRIARSARHHT